MSNKVISLFTDKAAVIEQLNEDFSRIKDMSVTYTVIDTDGELSFYDIHTSSNLADLLIFRELLTDEISRIKSEAYGNED